MIANTLRLSGLEVEPLSVSEVESKFDLTVYLSEREQRIHLSVVYNADLFCKERIEELLVQYEYLLDQVVAEPEAKIGGYSLVSFVSNIQLPDPKLSLDSSWQGTVHSRFSEQARKGPENLALVDGQQEWTYRELEVGSNRLAQYLRSGGVGIEDVVAIYGQRSASLVDAILGVHKAGAAFLILDPSYPAARQIEYLEAARPRGFLHLEQAGELPSELTTWVGSDAFDGCQLKLSGKDDERLAEFPAVAPEVLLGPESLAYVSFTSGSEGRPKGVLGRHGPLSHFLPWREKRFELKQTDRFSMLSGLAHDPLQRDIFTALWVGATVCIPEPEKMFSVGWLASWAGGEGITVAHLTPAMAEVLAAGNGRDESLKISSLRYAFFVGDKLTRKTVAAMGRLAPKVQCVNLYGSTETQRAISHFVVSAEAFGDDKGNKNQSKTKEVISIGQGIPDVQLLLLNRVQELCGVGEVGEIHFRSPHLARGYLDEPSLTAEKFIPDWFGEEAGVRIYRMGDVGRYLPDGNIEFLGRVDHQVKVRGFRIELGEIESLLEQHAEIRQAVVVVKGEGSEKQLVSYLVAAAEKSPPVEELRRYLSQRLPAYMVPSFYVELESLPLTPNGKVDRRALPEPTLVTEVGDEFLAPRDPIELHLAQLWESLLGVRPVGRRDNFFELGGHSLLAVRMVANIEKVYGKRLPLATLFEAPTVERVAHALKDKNWQPTWKSLVSIRAGGTKPPLFLMHSHGGNVLEYHLLARYLPKDQPVYALQSRGLDGKVDLDPDMREMAATYITEIKALQPEGPYYLAGFCFGGTLAYETAQQLRAQGDEVALLLMIQAVRAQAARKDAVIGLSKMLWYRIAYRLNLEWNNIAALAGGTRVRYIIDRAVRMNDLFELWYRSDSRLEELADRNGHRTTVYTLELLRRAHSRAFVKYRPKPYDGSVVLFPAEKQPRWRPRKPNLGWGDLVRGKLTTDVLRGYQQNLLLEPNVRFAAEKLTAHLEEALRHPAERLRRNRGS